MLSNEAIQWSLPDHSPADKLIAIEKIIQQNGAKAVFKTAFDWEGDDYAPLEAMGFAPELEDADRAPYIAYIAYIAHHMMSADEKTAYDREGNLDLVPC
ncbi:MAG: hypothetical protein ABFR19_07180 [Pseudomonadota bacterium]